MDLKDRRVLAKIREEARLITNFIDGLEIDGFLLNELIKRAVALTLANIGELCTVLSDDVKTKYKDIPWAAIRKTRNVISHDYESTDFTIIWQTAYIDIPVLVKKIDAIELDIGIELYSEVECVKNYDEILETLKDADDNEG